MWGHERVFFVFLQMLKAVRDFNSAVIRGHDSIKRDLGERLYASAASSGSHTREYLCVGVCAYFGQAFR